ncbi:unnamed protein product [Sphenostylis stenocarpa]|uniref:Disease resistance protein At4g27190-like leucine-rich repeats domain-containing protein n=1 Tax=Sphenostylis stenocarpa TaxID=92480 RepID=A0AA86T3F0_9FABA|nr:unnamed protein product [Sphenostylis stenocarpa]
MAVLEKAKNIKYLLCEGESMDLFSCKFDGSKLDILIVRLNENKNDYVEVQNSFFENIMGLRVLYLSSNVFYEKVTLSLPESIQSLTNLRSLYLQGFILGDISILGTLQDLETLELVSCVMDDLSIEITKLVKLKLLKLDCSEFKRNNSFQVIESCTSLEELYYITYYSNVISITSHNLKLPKYQRFCILDPSFSSIYIRGEWYKRNSLAILMADRLFSEVTFKNLVQKAEYLYLDRLQGGWKNLIPEIILPHDEGMNNKVVIILESLDLTCLIDNADSQVNDSNANEVIGQEMHVFLKNIALSYTQTTVTLQNVTDELKQIIGDDTKNQSKPFFPRLESLIIIKCNKLNCVFPISTSKIPPKLEYLVIIEAAMLEEVFQGKSDQKVGIPNLKMAVFVEFPRLLPGIESHALGCLVKNCPKLSLSSSLTLESFKHIRSRIRVRTIDDLLEDAKAQETSNQNPTTESTQDSAIRPEVEEAPTELTSSQKHAKQYDVHVNFADECNQQESDIQSNLVKQRKEVEEEQEIVEKDTGFGIPSTAISPTDSKLIRGPLAESKTSIEEGIMSGDGKKIAAPIDLKSENEEGQIAIPSSSILNMEPATIKDVGHVTHSNAPGLLTMVA